MRRLPMEQNQKRATVYFDPRLHKALRLKAAENDKSISEIVSEAVRQSFKEDAIDLSAVRKRRKEPCQSLEKFLEELSKSGLL